MSTSLWCSSFTTSLTFLARMDSETGHHPLMNSALKSQSTVYSSMRCLQIANTIDTRSLPVVFLSLDVPLPNWLRI